MQRAIMLVDLMVVLFVMFAGVMIAVWGFKKVSGGKK